MKYTKKPTKRQLEVLDFIQKYIEKHSIPPLIEDIKSAFQFRSTRSVAQYLDALTRQGYIERNRKQKRGIQLVSHYQEPGLDTVLVPLRGTASCGQPSFYADDNIEHFYSVDSRLLTDKVDNYFLVRSCGSSMNKAGIEDNDLVLVEKTDYFANGDKVVAVIDGLATIKNFSKGDSSIVLYPASSDDKHKPLIVKDDFNLVGRVVDILPDPESFNDIRYEPVN
jgi:repressor LexA